MNNERGQLSIFFGTTMIVVIGLIAFIINIGYFVKAKINLQNAVDAAAYAGASVQSRQLTNIAYLNWEMRNVYKEWMFKYYVLGNLNTDAVQVDSSTASDFRMKDLSGALVSSGGDKYNVPSICVDFSNTGDIGICRNYKVPGLPRFEAYDVQGMTETTNAIIDAIISQKNGDCAKRSALNYSTATLWAYNIVPKAGGTSSLITDSPQIATNRPGAFPAAFELAIRMRNLEAQVNKAPYTSGVCAGTSSLCSTTIDEITSTNSTANERISKAFMSAWRNLGGMAPEDTDLLKSSFTLKEISPNIPNTGQDNTLSNLLIPAGVARDKFYLDLKLQTINYATFYTAFVSQIDASTGTPKEGECEATKVGLPVPGYPLGFVKNPNVLTYYAVKGEALFIGLFNPFDFGEGIKLSAVAAAKPFGGRIGPALFNIEGTQATNILPIASGINISSGYAVGVQKLGANVNEFTPGDPLPLGTFWQSNMSEAIGGWVSGDIKFVMPNLIYDYPNSLGDSSNSYLSTDPVSIQATSSQPSANTYGLYNGDMMKKFKDNLGGLTGLTPDKIDKGILSARAATSYDLKNYLVPTPETVNSELDVNSYGFILDSESSGSGNSSHDQVYNYNIYAPVFSDDPDVLYKNISEVTKVLDEFLQNQIPSIQQYVDSMKLTASNIYRINTSTNSNQNTAVGAANTIADIPVAYMSEPLNSEAKVSCTSIAGKFAYFYTGKTSLVNDSNGACSQIDSLPKLLTTYWNQNQDKLGNYYEGQYTIKNNGDIPRMHFNAFNPNQSPDSSSGVFKNTLRNTTTNMFRNYYSTKFVSLKSLMGISQGYSPNINFSIFSDGTKSNENSSLKQIEFSNALLPDSVEFNPDSINH